MIAIVGGGPVGLATAIELGVRGLDCVVIEQGDGQVGNAKFVDINMRTMEFCRRWGIADEIRDRGFNRDYAQDLIYVTTLTGYLLGRQPFPAFSQFRTPPTTPERIARCPQTIFDPILRRTAEALPSVRWRYQTRCENVTQDADGVTLTLADTATGKREELRARYVACCEGASSRIREALGIELEGAGMLSLNANVVFYSEEFLRVHDKGPGFYTAIGPEGRWASVLAIDGATLWRLQITKPFETTDFPTADAEAWVRRFMGRDFAFEVRSAIVWSRREVVASSYRSGRVFLLGDAAHQLSPTGGFGLNTGIGDVTNLAWKLAAVIDGWGGPELLPSYETERKPIGTQNVRAATGRWQHNEAVGGTPGPAILESGAEGDRVRAEVEYRAAADPRSRKLRLRLRAALRRRGHAARLLIRRLAGDRARRHAAAAQRSSHLLPDRAARHPGAALLARRANVDPRPLRNRLRAAALEPQRARSRCVCCRGGEARCTIDGALVRHSAALPHV